MSDQQQEVVAPLQQYTRLISHHGMNSQEVVQFETELTKTTAGALMVTAVRTIIAATGNELLRMAMDYAPKEGLKDFQTIQAEIGVWARSQFGENESRDGTATHYQAPLGSLPALLGMMEEIGELARVVARRIQGRGFEDPVQAQVNKADALADTLVFMCDYATREGINLNVVLHRVWEKVSQRRQATWAQDKAKEVPIIIEQDGHGFGHVVTEDDEEVD